MTIKPETILSVEVFYDAEEIKEDYKRNLFTKATDEAVVDYIISGNASDEDVLQWSYDITTLENWNYLGTTRVENILSCFNKEEQNYILDWINNAGISFENIAGLLSAIRYYTSWITEDEVSEDDIIFAQNGNKCFVWKA